MNYDKYINGRAKAIPPSGIRKFFDIVSTMKGAISLGVGEPDFITPWGIREAGIRSIRNGYTQYTSNRGLPKLREEIAYYMSTRYHVDYSPENEIIVTVGASEAVDIALRTLVDVGDEVLIPDPSYVSYSPCVTLAGGVPVSLHVGAESEFKLLPEELESKITGKSKVLFLSYPNNPTGAIMEREYLEKIAEVVKKHDLIVITDEIYGELTYDATHVSVASLPGMRERCVMINGFSKCFAMTGWRIGYVAAPRELCSAMHKIHQYAIMCASTASQYAALNALQTGREDDYASIREMRDEYDMRRRFLVGAIRDAGLKCFEPKGAFYVFPSVKELGVTGQEFAEGLLKAKKVAVVPGDAFGESGKYHIRCCYAASLKNLTTACGLIAEYVNEIK